MTTKAEQLIQEVLESGTRPHGTTLLEAPAAVKLIWKKLPPSTRSKVSIDQLRDFLGFVIDDGESVKQAATMVKMPAAYALGLWSDIEKTGMV